MTKKDFKKFAAIFAAERALCLTLAERTVVENLVASTADVFAQGNPRFDRKRFYLAALGRETLRP
jgi:hypothetical protein